MVPESEGDYPSQWQAIQPIASKIGCSPDSLKAWLKRTQIDASDIPGTTTDKRERMKILEKENVVVGSKPPYRLTLRSGRSI